MARLPNGCSRILCALLQFGSDVSAVNSPSPPTARTRRSEPRTALSKRFSSLSSSTRSWPETITSGAPIMSSQKIGPSSLVSRTRCCTGAVESSDSMLPTTGLVGGCGIGLSRLVDAICVIVSWLGPGRYLNRHCERSEAIHDHKERVDCFVASLLAMTVSVTSPKSSFTPFDQLGADLARLFLLRPMAAAPNQVFLEIGNDLLHAVGRGWRQHPIVFGHDHQRRHPYCVVDPGRALPVARHIAVPVDASGEARFGKGIDEHLLFLRRQDRRARIVFGVVVGNHLRERQIEPWRCADTGGRRLHWCGLALRNRLAHEGVEGLFDPAVENLVGTMRGILKLHDIHVLAEALAQQFDRVRRR